MKHWLSRRMIVGICGVIVALAGLVWGLVSSKQPVPIELNHTRWELITPLGDEAALRGTERRRTLEFADGKLSGSGGCNHFSGSYRVDGATIVIGDNLSSTQMACLTEFGGAPIADREGEYLRLVGTATEYRAAGGDLELICDEGRVVLRFQPLR